MIAPAPPLRNKPVIRPENVMPLAVALMLLPAPVTVPASTPVAPATTLAKLGRTGELMIEAGDGRGERAKVLEIGAALCRVTFKTRIDERGLTARIIDLGEGSSVDRIGDDAVRLRGSTEFRDMSAVVSGDRTQTLFKALQAVRESCRADTSIF